MGFKRGLDVYETGELLKAHLTVSVLFQNMKKNSGEQDTLTFHLMVYEKFLLIDSLCRTNGNCTQAARNLGISERAFFYRLKKHEIDYKGFRKNKSMQS